MQYVGFTLTTSKNETSAKTIKTCTTILKKSRSQLDMLSKELHPLTEHGVSLDANFSKFGYDAHLSA